MQHPLQWLYYFFPWITQAFIFSTPSNIHLLYSFPPWMFYVFYGLLTLFHSYSFLEEILVFHQMWSFNPILPFSVQSIFIFFLNFSFCLYAVFLILLFGLFILDATQVLKLFGPEINSHVPLIFYRGDKDIQGMEETVSFTFAGETGQSLVKN